VNSQGRPLDPNNEMTIRNVRGSECMKMAWHPLLPLLAIGWKDGALRAWDVSPAWEMGGNRPHEGGEEGEAPHARA
jgi:hypothetical protein